MKKLLLLIYFILFSVNINAQIGGYALKFDGENDYVVVPHNSSLDFTAFTVEMWIYVDDYHDEYKLLGKTLPNSHETGFNIGITSKKLLVEAWGGDISNSIKGESLDDIPLTKWVHVAMSWSAGGYLKGYINGVEVVSLQSGSFAITTDNSMYIGIAPWIDLNENHFRGKMDEIRVWNVVRTQEEINTNMYKEIGTHANLKAYYKMSNGTGTTLTDNSVTGNNGTLTNGPEWKVSGCFAGSRNALDFDGINEYVNFTSIPPYNNNTITLEAWIKATSSADELEIMSWSPQATEFRMQGGKLQFGIDADGWSDVIGTTNINTGNWTHVAVVKNNTSVKLYVNGILDASGTINDVPTTNLFQIAHNPINETKYYFPGQIDEVRIWHSVRAESQIRENMMRNLIGNEDGLVAYYRFDQYGGDKLYDLTGNGKNGTLTNMEVPADWVSSSAYNTWIGSENPDWATADNWSNGAPVETDNVGLYKWDLGSETTIASSSTVNNILFSNTASPAITDGYNINGNLLLEKDIVLNAGQQINFSTTGYLSEGTNHLKGDNGVVVYSLLTSGALTSYKNIAGFGLYLKNNESSEDIIDIDISRMIGADPYEDFTKPVKRAYTLGECTTPIDARFYYDETEFAAETSEGDLKLFSSSDNGTSWTKIGTATHNATDNYFEVLNVTPDRYYTFADNTSPLPVELASFNAICLKSRVILNWQTATEINNYGFEIEKAEIVDGKTGNFSKIGFVEGHGNSNTIIDYSFTDNKVSFGKYSYRLKQIDNDGKATYSQVVEVNTQVPTAYCLNQNYPNPFNPTTAISFTIPNNEFVSLKIYDVLGNEVATLINKEMTAGMHKEILDATNLSSGVYFYKLQAGKFTETKKMILAK